MVSPNTRRTLKKVTVFGVFALVVALLWRAPLDLIGTVFLWLLVVPAAFGAAVALAIRHFGQAPAASNRLDPDRFTNDRPSDVINMSRIRVAGIGGLGFVAMAAVVAFALPRVGDTVLLGLVGGAVAAALVIVHRRRSGPLSSNGPRGRTYLVERDEKELPPAPRGDAASPDGTRRRTGAVPAFESRA